MRINVVIPARYSSTRFPGKPLVDIKGISMIQRVYLQASEATLVDDVYVATDDERIFKHVQSFGGKVIYTSPLHESGTDRIAEAYTKMSVCDYIINVQGDEPFINPKQIDDLARLMIDTSGELGTMVKEIEDFETLFNPNTPKVVLNNANEAIYFSRQPIPYLRGLEESEWLGSHRYYKHIGMYAYRTDVLPKLTSLPISSLEKAESLEQLRWIENGYKIHITTTEFDTFGIDVPEDLNRV